MQGYRHFFTNKAVRNPADLSGLRIRTPWRRSGRNPCGRFYEVLKFANEKKHIMLINFQIVSTTFFDGLPTDYQTALVEECQRAGRETSEKILASEKGVKDLLKQRGMTVVEDVDLAAFRAAGEKA